MKNQFIFTTILLLLLSITHVFGYLGERHSPFIVSFDKKSSSSSSSLLEFKRGDTIQINWGLTLGVRFPLYGYASARTSKTDVGLLAPKPSRTQPYLYTIDTDVSVLDYTYTWTIDKEVPTGKYQIGVGFFYHEMSPEIHIVE